MGKQSRLRGDTPDNRRTGWQGATQNQVAPSQPRKGPRDRDDCPAGWDADLWSLTLRFEQDARADRIDLKAGRPVIYSELADLVARHEMRTRTYPQAVKGCTRRLLDDSLAEKCWLHYNPQHPGSQWERDLGWVEMVEVIMAEFWSRVWDEYALDGFRHHFREYGQLAVGHWISLRVAQRSAERREHERATMSDDSKEG